MDQMTSKAQTGDQLIHSPTSDSQQLAFASSRTMNNTASKRQNLHTSNNNNNSSSVIQLEPASTSHKQTICKQRRPQELQAAAESNQNEARALRRVAATTEHVPAHRADENHPAATARPPMVVVLRRCEDLRIRTSGFQKIEEDSQRRPMDLRRQHKLLEQQQQQQQQHQQQRTCSNMHI